MAKVEGISGMSLPIACSLEEQELADRVSAWASLFEESLIHRSSSATGVRIQLRSAPDVLQRLEELIELEAKCCAWMSFTIAGEDELTVDIHADDAFGQQAIRETFLPS